MGLPGFPSPANIRITTLLALLLVVGGISAHQHIYSRNWSETLGVSIIPLNGDGRAATDAYIASLQVADFGIIERWAKREARRHDLDLVQPIVVRLAAAIETLPPPFPTDDPNPVDVLAWGLRFRLWAFRHTPDDHAGLTRVRLFVVYHSGEDDSPLAHSLGMKKGLMGLVHAFAVEEQNAQNAIVIAHELLHTVGALDKYEAYGNPAYPVGYANPRRSPLYPQRSAEIMAGRIPTSRYSSYMAESLKSVVINRHTAAEINWLNR